MVSFTVGYNVNDMRSPSVVCVLEELGGEMLPNLFNEMKYNSGAIDAIWIKHS